MEKNADDVGLAFFAMVFGMLLAQHWLAQFATSIITIVLGIVVAHFVKRELHRRWPLKKLETKETE